MADQNELFNVGTRKPETLPFEQIPKAILDGTHSYAANSKINVVDESGQSFNLPSTQLRDALKEGYRLESPRETAIREYVAENKGSGGAAKVFAAKAGDEALMGIPGLIYDKTGDPFEVAKYEALKKEHGLATAAGATAGFLGSLVVGGPLFKGAAKVGSIAERAVAEQLAAAGIERGAKSAAKDIVARMTTTATRLGTEGVAITTPRALTEEALGDPDASAESLLAGGALGGFLGAGAGALSGPFSRLKGAIINTVGEKLSPVAERAVQVAQSEAGVGEQGLVGAAVEQGAEEPTLKQIMDGLKAQKPNAPEIAKASETLGVPTLEGQLSASKFIQDLHSSIISKPTPTGIAQANKLGQIVQGVKNGLEHALGGGSELSAEEVGDRIRDHLTDKIDEQTAKFTDAYQNIIKADTKHIPVDSERLENMAKGIIPRETLKFETGATKDALQELKDRFGLIENVNDIKLLRTKVNGELQAAYRGGNYALADMLQNAKSKLNTLEQESILQSAIENAPTKAEGEKVAAELSGLIKKTNGEYAEFQDMLKSLSQDAKLGKAKGAFGVEQKLEQTSGTRLVEKLFDKKNPKALERLREQFPEAYDLLIKHQRTALLKRGLRDGELNPGRVIHELKQLSPEVQGHLLSPRQQELFDAARTVHESLPPNINPSGTAKTLAFYDLLTPRGAVGAAGDAAKMQIVKASRAQGLLEAEQSMKKAAFSLDKIPGAINALTRMGEERGVVPAALGQDYRTTKKERHEELHKIRQSAETYAANPASLINEVAKQTGIFAETGAPKTAQALSDKLMNTVNYVQEIAPKPLVPQNPLRPTEPYKPSDQEMAKFERKMNVIFDPWSVIDDLKKGTLTPDQVEALRTVYPVIHKSIQMRIEKHLSEKQPKLPYQSRLKLSLLMGVNVDNSIGPQFVAGLQSNYLQPNETPQAQKFSVAASTATEAQQRELGS